MSWESCFEFGLVENRIEIESYSRYILPVQGFQYRTMYSGYFKGRQRKLKKREERAGK
jgi:hypothetical protein